MKKSSLEDGELSTRLQAPPSEELRGGADITRMLQAARHGDQSAADQLMNVVYSDLRRVARHYMSSERADHTLQPTAVVNEVFLRLFRPADADPAAWQSISVDWQSRAHFLAVAAKQMRQVLVDHARQKRAVKRDFGVKIAIDDPAARSLAARPEQEFEQIDELLNLLATKYPDAARVVELKFFGGLTDDETVLIMGSNKSKVRRDWEFARAWLAHRLPHREKS